MEYDGHKQTHDEPGIADTTIAASNNFYVAKEEHRRYVDDLLPDFIYTFNISAKFLDGTFGPPTKLRIETSPGELFSVTDATEPSPNIMAKDNVYFAWSSSKAHKSRQSVKRSILHNMNSEHIMLYLI